MPSTTITAAKHILRHSANSAKTNTKSPRRKSSTPPQFLRSTPELARHSCKCVICHHPQREMIEDLFVHWHSPEAICSVFTQDGVGWIAIYRHAYALGLDEVRRRNLRFVFEHILGQAHQITPTSASIIAAAHALGACVNETGQWREPSRRVVVTNIVKGKSKMEHSEPAASNEAPVAASRTCRPASESGAAPASPAEDDFVGATLGSPVAADKPRTAERSASSQACSDADESGSLPIAPSTRAESSESPGFDEISATAREIRNSRNSLITKESQISNR